ncbi:MAG TPA: ester cyclase [Candidatus Dormibacteraeota bacterium]
MADLERLVRRLFDAIEARDVEQVKAMYTADCEYVRSDGVSKGPEAIAAYLDAVAAGFPDHAYHIEAVHVAGDVLTVEWTETATHTQPFASPNLGTIPPTGKSFEIRIAEVMRFEGERIASQHEYYDRLSLLRQLGWLGALLAAQGTPTS